MEKFVFRITETYAMDVVVEAEDIYDAQDTLERLYYDAGIINDVTDNFDSSEIEYKRSYEESYDKYLPSYSKEDLEE